MANKIVEIMQYNGSTNDNLIPQKAQQADNATNATNAQNAVIGQYASSDTSKGTIDNRLNFLEGSQSSMTFLSGVSATSTKNQVIRSGKYCVFNLDSKINSSLYISLTLTQIGTIPQGYRPKTDFDGWAVIRRSNNYDYIMVDIYASTGAVYISSAAVGDVNNIYFSLGYEAQSI